MRPETTDRRLIMRVLATWKKIAGERAFPRRSQIDPRLFGRDWSHCVLVDIDPALDRSRLAYVGDTLRDPSWPPFERQCSADFLDGSLLQLATAQISVVLARGVPISFGGSAVHDEGPILYRSILLPLSEDGAAIDGVLAAVNYREVAAPDEVHLDDPARKSEAGTGAGLITGGNGGRANGLLS
jgi:hypothetical protein